MTRERIEEARQHLVAHPAALADFDGESKIVWQLGEESRERGQLLARID